jgi:hypothetical protein
MEGLKNQWSEASITAARLPAQTAWRSRPVRPEGRVMLSSGLSLRMPHRWRAELASTSLTSEPAQMFMPLTLHPGGAWYGEILSLRDESDRQLLGATDRDETQVVARSDDGTVEIYGPKPGDATQADSEADSAVRHREWVTIVTRLPGRTIGLVQGYVTTKEPGFSETDAWRFARWMWTNYRVEGAELPLPPAE